MGFCSDRSCLKQLGQFSLDVTGCNDLSGCQKYQMFAFCDGAVNTLNKFSITPAEIKAASGWATGTNFEIDLVAHSAIKAHVLARN